MKGKPLRAASLCALVAFASQLSACQGWAHYRGTTTYQTTVDPDRLYAGAVRVLLRHGLGFQSRDPSARAIETEWFRTRHRAVLALTFVSYRVIISGGRLEFFTSCHTFDGMVRKTCEPDERPPGTEETEDEFVREIFAEAQTL